MQLKETREVVVKTICDKCGEEFLVQGWGLYDFKFKVTDGEVSPSGGSGMDYDLDLCKSCMLDLIKYLDSNGYAVNKSKWGF